MSRSKKQRLWYTCERCGHQWTPRVKQPQHCPYCNSPYWDRPRQARRTSAPAPPSTEPLPEKGEQSDDTQGTE